MEIEILFIRHGITEANCKGYVSGSRYDLPLCETGVNALRNYAIQGYYPASPEMLFTSALTRTKQTCEIIFPGKSYTPLAILNERDFGPIESECDPEVIRKWRDRLFCMADTKEMWQSGGEDSRIFMQRIRQGMEQVVNKTIEANAKSLGIVGHGGYLKYFCRAFNIPEKAVTEQPCIENGKGAYFICYYKNGEIETIDFLRRLE